MALRPEDNLIAHVRTAAYIGMTIHFLRKILGKVSPHGKYCYGTSRKVHMPAIDDIRLAMVRKDILARANPWQRT